MVNNMEQPEITITVSGKALLLNGKKPDSETLYALADLLENVADYVSDIEIDREHIEASEKRIEETVTKFFE